MLTVADARRLADTWRPRFADQVAFITSVERYLERFAPPTRSPESLERWLREDAEQDDVRSTLLGSRPTENAPQRLPEHVADCATCLGYRYVHLDVPITHSEFGKALRCPDCANPANRHPLPERPLYGRAAGYICWKCYAAEDEPPNDGCTHPSWHTIGSRSPINTLPIEPKDKP